MGGRITIGVLAAALVVAASLTGDARAGSAPSRDVSTNWAGYVVTGAYTRYTSVTGTWRQPKVTCGSGDAGASSGFWVGLGGYYTSSQALEQIGTSSECNARTGRPTYYAWYELMPQASVTIAKLAISHGDLITTSVNIVGDGQSVLLQVKNRTTRKAYTTTLSFPEADLSSAEWIAEAPAGCGGTRCPQLELANFGSVQFTRIAALGNSVGGTLTSNPAWDATAVSLAPAQRSGPSPGGNRYAPNAASTAGAKPSAPAPDGRGFAVTWVPGPATS